jgi:hypothetical protein
MAHTLSPQSSARRAGDQRSFDRATVKLKPQKDRKVRKDETRVPSNELAIDAMPRER